MHYILIIISLILLSTPATAMANASKRETGKNNSQSTKLHVSSNPNKTVTTPTDLSTKPTNIADRNPSKAKFKPPAMQQNKEQLPSIVNAYNYLYSNKNWNSDNSKTPSPFGTTDFNEFALKGNLYYLKPNTVQLPEFSAMTAVGIVYIPSLNIPKRNFTTGFPGVDKRFEWFGVRYIGGFKIDQGAQYKFRLVSDDGSKLWIDNQLVIDNDGIHPHYAKSGVIKLSSGKHLIQVDYFQGPRTSIGLQLYITEPGAREKIFKPKFSSNKTVHGELTVGKQANETPKFILKFVRLGSMEK